MQDKTPQDALPANKQPAIRVAAMPKDTNAHGDIFGGWIMSQVDIAGSIVARQRAGRRVVTVAVQAFQFHHPVFVGDLISCYAEISRIGTTSITVQVEVYAQRQDLPGAIRVTEATVTYVAIDDNRRPVPVAKPDPAAPAGGNSP